MFVTTLQYEKLKQTCFNDFFHAVQNVLSSISAIRHSIVFLSCFSALIVCQQHSLAQVIDDAQLANDERLQDPPADLRKRNLGTSPALPRSFGKFKSVQVNVDPNGNNIVGDAANEPSLALNRTNPDNMVVGWRQFDSITSNFRQAGCGFTTDGGNTWNNNGPLEPGVFRSDPVLASDASGSIFYYSLSTNKTFDNFFCDMFISNDGGATWSNPIPARGGDKQWMAIDNSGGRGDGFIYAMWNSFFSCCESGYFTRSIDNGFTYSQPTDEPTAIFWGTLSVGPEGELYICGRDGSNNHGVIKSFDAQLGDVDPTFPQIAAIDLGGFNVFGEGPNPGGLLGQFDVDTDHSNSPNRGNVYFLGSVSPAGPDPLDIMFARSTDGGFTWDAPIRVNNDPLGEGRYNWFGTMSVAPCGRIDIIWNDMRDDSDGTMSAMFYSNSTDGGLTFSENVQVTPAFNSLIGHPNQDKMGDYYDMRSTNDAVHIAYAATFNGEQDVYYLRIDAEVIPGDVNRDGTVDLLDIAPFVDALSSSEYQLEADVNKDGQVNLLDVQPLVELLAQ